MNSLVSILIPVYNSGKFLAETLDSALSQTYKNIEIIVIDDGSTDNSLEIAQQFESSKVKVIRQENQGQSAAENRALLEAQGDFIQYLDADDLLAPNKIELQMQLLREHSPECVVAGEWSRFYESPQEAQFIAQPPWADMSPVDWLLCVWNGHYMMHGAAWLIPRKVIDKAGPWCEELSLINDFDYFSRIVLASQGIKFCWGARTYYRSGNINSLSGTKSHQAWKSAYQSLELGTSHLLAYENSPRTQKVCATVFQRFIYEVYPDVPELRQKAHEIVTQLGGSGLKPSGGPAFKVLAQLLGWKYAKKLQRYAYFHGYQRLVSSHQPH